MDMYPDYIFVASQVWSQQNMFMHTHIKYYVIMRTFLSNEIEYLLMHCPVSITSIKGSANLKREARLLTHVMINCNDRL